MPVIPLHGRTAIGAEFRDINRVYKSRNIISYIRNAGVDRGWRLGKILAS